MYAGVMETFADLRFQVDDLWENMHDRTLLVTHGHFTTYVVGLSGSPTPAGTIAAELVYTPLTRQADGGAKTRDDYLGARLFIGFVIP
jgi:hypothetical protein